MAVPFVLTALLAWAAAPPPTDEPPAPPDTFRPDPAWKPLGPDLWFDAAGQRLVLRARVALRDGPLEHLLCLQATKEHEATLATRVPAHRIHAGLLLLKAQPGHPVRYRPRFEPPTGTPIRIDLEWPDAAGKTRRVNARDWIKDEKSGKLLATDWVFAGSEFFTDPETKQEQYAADGGDIITVANFPSAMLDLPFASTPNDADRTFVANTPLIPPRNTPVTVFLKPIRDRKPPN